MDHEILGKRLFKLDTDVSLYEGKCGYQVVFGSDEPYVFHFCIHELSDMPVILVIRALIALGEIYAEKGNINRAEVIAQLEGAIKAQKPTVKVH